MYDLTTGHSLLKLGYTSVGDVSINHCQPLKVCQAFDSLEPSVIYPRPVQKRSKFGQSLDSIKARVAYRRTFKSKSCSFVNRSICCSPASVTRGVRKWSCSSRVGPFDLS